MQVDEQQRLTGAAWCPSAHWDERPDGAAVDLVVVHCVSLPEGQFNTGYPQQLFTGCLDCDAHESFADLRDLRVAPHLFVARDGAVCQFVALDKRAWHAGESSWRGRRGCNDYSIGIELEGCIAQAYEAAQYQSLHNVLRALLRRYETLSVDAVVGHNEIAPGRKFDPGPQFDWARVLRNLA